tara:strand:+ start:23844 stop:24413 length:570 start_codon:yes stop_codon:yes gene_type:complete
MERSLNYRHLSRKLACSNSLFNVYFDHLLLEENEVEDYLIIKPKISIDSDHIVGVCVLPEVDLSYGLMKGWRHQFDTFIWQAPAGFVESGEEPSQTAIRELKEETSLICEPENLISLGSFIPDAGLIQGKVALYLARDSKLIADKKSNEVGTGNLCYFSRDDLMNLICTNSNIGGSTITTSIRALQYGN